MGLIMKLKYKILLTIIMIETSILWLIGNLDVIFLGRDIKIDKFPINMIAIFIFLLPICITLCFVSKDKNFSKKIRTASIVAFLFIVILYVSVTCFELLLN
jgi:hypothetical protein